MRVTFTTLFALSLAACATTPGATSVDASDAAEVVETPLPKPLFEVRPVSRESEHLFAIEDPLTLAVEARWNGENELAYQHFYAAWLATPESVDVNIGLIDMALKTGKFEQAYLAASKLVINPDTAKPKLLAAQVLAELAVGKSPDPEIRLNQALERHPNDPRLWNALGGFHDKQGQPLRAQDCYMQALKTGGTKASVVNNLGMSLLLSGDTRSALAKFEQASELDTHTPIYDNNRRLSLALLGQYDRAADGLADDSAADILNDAGYIARSREDIINAASLFKAAIARSTRYHTKAHENLRALQTVR